MTAVKLLVVIGVIASGVLWYRHVQHLSKLSKMPNVIFIMVDALRADHVGCYGYHRNTTPNIDRFASTCMRFKNVRSQAPRTYLSVPSFLSSQYPQDRGIYYTSLMHVLGQYGYRTGAVISNYEAGNKGGLRAWPWQFWDDRPCMENITSPDVEKSSANWLSTLPREPRRPFFLFSLFIDPHAPYTAHKGHIYDPAYNGPDKDQVDLMGAVYGRTKAPCSLEHMNALYDSEIAFTDEYIGKFLNELKKRGLYDNSLIVFIADHGEEFQDHGDFFHGKTLYKEVLSVPLIIKLPKQAKGSTVDGTFSLIDLAPSILKYLGVDPGLLEPQGKPMDLDGLRSISDQYIYSASEPGLRSVQNAEYELIRGHSCYGSDVTELYDLKRDPSEHRNIALQSKDVVTAMTALLVKHEKDVQKVINKVRKANQAEPLTNAEKQRLKSLGYLGN